MDRWEFIAFVVSISGLTSLIFEIDHLDNTFGGALLFFISVIMGATCAILLLLPLIFSKWFGHVAKSDKDWLWHLAAILVGVAFFTATGASLLNRKLAAEPQVERFYIVRKGDSPGRLDSRGKQWYLFLDTPRGDERIVIPKSAWSTLEAGTFVSLHVQSGFFGYHYIGVPARIVLLGRG